MTIEDKIKALNAEILRLRIRMCITMVIDGCWLIALVLLGLWLIIN